MSSFEESKSQGDYLKETVTAFDLEKIRTVSELLTAFNRTSFQSRTLAKCANIFVEMLEDPMRPTVFLGLAGAMVPAGMKGVVSTTIRRRMVDVIVSTGANMYHDFIEAFGEHHYIGSPDVDDMSLRKTGIDRIYDTFMSEEKFGIIENMVTYFANNLVNENVTNVSSRQFLHGLGKLIEEKAPSDAKKDSIIWNCWKEGVPIFVPAFNDSSLGLAVTEHYIEFMKKGQTPLVIDQIKDNVEILSIKRASPKTGIFLIGGGVPKNYIQQTAFLERQFGIPDVEHEYGIQLTTDSPQWGGLSGCTFREGISWGKEKPSGRYATCYCDATIAFPLIVKAALERCLNLDKRKRLKFDFQNIT